MNELFDISDSILGELQAHEEDDSGVTMNGCSSHCERSCRKRWMRSSLAKSRRWEPLARERDEAKECDSAVDDLADLEERLFGAEKRLQEAEASAAQAAGC